MSEHLLIDLNQLYRLYSVSDIYKEYYEYNFLPCYNTIENEILYDIINCLSQDQLTDLSIFIYKQWSLLKIDPEIHNLPTAKRRNKIIKRDFTCDPVVSKREFNDKLGLFIDNDKVLGIYVINQILKFLYPCKL